jgi:hypothetical protein
MTCKLRLGCLTGGITLSVCDVSVSIILTLL